MNKKTAAIVYVLVVMVIVSVLSIACTFLFGSQISTLFSMAVGLVTGFKAMIIFDDKYGF